MILVYYSDYFTNHSRPIVRELIQESDKNYAQANIFATMYSHIYINIAVLALGLLAFLCWYLAGFYGLMMGAVGLMSSSLTILTISFLGFITGDSF